MKQRKAKPTAWTLTRLRASRVKWGVTLAAIAAEAAKTSRFGTMSIATVSKALSGDTLSWNVIHVTKRLIAEARARAAQPQEPAA